MAMKRISFTKEGFGKLKKEYEKLMGERPLAVLELRKAREMGDLSENGYYKATKSKLSSIDHHLRILKNQLQSGAIIANTNTNVINIGNTATLKNGNEEIIYQIVGDLEANPNFGKISSHSPIGKALIGKSLNDEIVFQAPKGEIRYTIIGIH